MRLRFNITLELVEISYGVQSGIIFTSHFGELTSYTSDSFIPFDQICGIINSTYRSPYGTYYTKYFGYPAKM